MRALLVIALLAAIASLAGAFGTAPAAIDRARTVATASSPIGCILVDRQRRTHAFDAGWYVLSSVGKKIEKDSQ